MKKCLSCGKEFETNKPSKIYCSRLCAHRQAKRRSDARKKEIKIIQKETKNCLNCGKEFETENLRKIYCSSICANKSSRKRNRKEVILENKIKTCLQCNQTFSTTNPRKIYCSAVCTNKASRKRNRKLSIKIPKLPLTEEEKRLRKEKKREYDREYKEKNRWRIRERDREYSIIYNQNNPPLSYEIQGEEFIFDKIGLKMYLEEFVHPSFDIVIIDGYLARDNKFNDYKPQFFHRWLKIKRTKKDMSNPYLQVHHHNGNTRDNRIKNLKLLDSEKHHSLHKKKMAYKTYKEKFYADNPDADPQLMNWHWARFKERNFID